MTVDYYVMECRAPAGQAEAMVAEWPDIPGIDSWWSGARFEQRIEEPVRCVLHPHYTDGLLPLFNDEILLMTRHLLECIRGAGVNNLDCYQAVLIDPNTGHEYKEYLAVNVVGVVSAANLSGSSVAPGSADRLVSVDFDGISINLEAALGFKLFRLAENVSAVLVHESVRQAVKGCKGFESVQFLQPGEWIG